MCLKFIMLATVDGFSRPSTRTINDTEKGVPQNRLQFPHCQFSFGIPPSPFGWKGGGDDGVNPYVKTVLHSAECSLIN